MRRARRLTRPRPAASVDLHTAVRDGALKALELPVRVEQHNALAAAPANAARNAAR